MNKDLQRYLISSLTTFLAAFFGAASVYLMEAGSIELTSSFIFAALSVSVRAGFKAVVEGIARRHSDLE